MTFTIITPTLQRQSLRDTCESLDNQTCQDFEHFVMVDGPVTQLELLEDIMSPNRIVNVLGVSCGDGGNTPRNLAWLQAKGKWVIYLDDDNLLADDEVLADIADALEDRTEKWAIFPITRLGGRFFSDPPRNCHTDTLNLVFRRDVAEWPVTDAYGTDGIMIDRLTSAGEPCAAFPAFRPIGIVPKISFCQ